MKLRILPLVIISVTLFSFSQNSTLAATDGLNLSQALMVSAPSGVASWPSTATITTTDLTSNIIVDFDKRDGTNRWPDQHGGSGVSAGDSIQYTLWMFVKIDGNWVGAPFVQFWYGRDLTGGGSIQRAPCDLYYSDRWAPMFGHKINVGDDIGLMVTSGNNRNGGTSIEAFNQRSNVVVIKSPVASVDPSSCGTGGSGDTGGTGGTGGTGQDPTVSVPPVTNGGTATAATTGWAGSAAFNPINNLYLVVSQGANKQIEGRVMNSSSKPVGATVIVSGNLSGPNLAPKVAYSPDIKKFLVVWLKENSQRSLTLFGQFVNPDGTLSGGRIQIDQGNFIFFTTAGNNPMRYDGKNKRFVLAYEDRGNNIQVRLTAISTSGQVVFSKLITDSSQGTYNGAPGIAVNPDNNEYCVSYQHVNDGTGRNNQSQVRVVPVDASTFAVGGASTLTNDIFFNYGIDYSTTDHEYLPIWSDFAVSELRGKFIDSCADNTEDEFTISQNRHNAVISYNPTSNTFGIVVVDPIDPTNHLIILDGSGSEITNQALFGGGGGNFNPSIAANTTNGTFAAISSEDYKTTYFLSGIGTGDVSIVSTRPLAKSSTPPVPSSGLPTDLGSLVESIFYWSLNILGLVIFIRFFFAGFKWFTARGNASVIGEAKDMMLNAVYGAIILFAAYLILYTINPDLVRNVVNVPGLPASRTTTQQGGPPVGTAIDNASKAQALLTAIGSTNFSTDADCKGTNQASQNIQDMASGKYPAVCSPSCTCKAGGTSGTITVNPAILDGLLKLSTQKFDDEPIGFTVQSFTTGKHEANSAHYTGHAVDITPHSSSPADWKEVRTYLNSLGGKAICEDPNTHTDVESCATPVNHIHWTD